MEISILGTLTATRNNVSIAPSAAKPRTLLALLAAHEGHVVPLDVIIAELWEEEPPPSALTTLQTYVLQLRKILGCTVKESDTRAHPKDILRTEASGYALDQEAGKLDAAEYLRLASRGYDAFQTGDYQTAKSHMEEALALWRGPAYMDIVTGPKLSAHKTMLEESRKTVHERRIAADLQLGRHHELIGELAGLTAQNTTDERLCAHFMIALSRAGHRDRALNAFSLLRRALRTNLGLDPTPELDKLHRAILSGDVGTRSDSTIGRELRHALSDQRIHMPARRATSIRPLI